MEESPSRAGSLNSHSQKGSVVAETLTKPLHTHQHRFHQHCGHTQRDKNSESTRSRGDKHNKTLGSLSGRRTGRKFVEK